MSERPKIRDVMQRSPTQMPSRSASGVRVRPGSSYRAARRGVARAVRREKTKRASFEGLVHRPPPRVPPRTVRRDGTARKVAGLVDRLQRLTDQKTARSRV